MIAKISRHKNIADKIAPTVSFTGQYDQIYVM